MPFIICLLTGYSFLRRAVTSSSFLEEKTINETENFLITVLKESNEISKKVSDLLKNHIDDLYPKYKRLYVKIISSPEIEENLNFNEKSYQ